MKTMRKGYTGDFMAKVALMAIPGDLTPAQLSAKHRIHPTMIASWKRQAIDGMARHFRARAKQPRARARARSRSCT